MHWAKSNNFDANTGMSCWVVAAVAALISFMIALAPLKMRSTRAPQKFPSTPCWCIVRRHFSVCGGGQGMTEHDRTAIPTAATMRPSTEWLEKPLPNEQTLFEGFV